MDFRILMRLLPTRADAGKIGYDSFHEHTWVSKSTEPGLIARPPGPSPAVLPSLPSLAMGAQGATAAEAIARLPEPACDGQRAAAGFAHPQKMLLAGLATARQPNAIAEALRSTAASRGRGRQLAEARSVARPRVSLISGRIVRRRQDRLHVHRLDASLHDHLALHLIKHQRRHHLQRAPYPKFTEYVKVACAAPSSPPHHRRQSGRERSHDHGPELPIARAHRLRGPRP